MKAAAAADLASKNAASVAAQTRDFLAFMAARGNPLAEKAGSPASLGFALKRFSSRPVGWQLDAHDSDNWLHLFLSVTGEWWQFEIISAWGPKLGRWNQIAGVPANYSPGNSMHVLVRRVAAQGQ